VAAAIRTIFAQPDREAARLQLAEVVKAMHNRWPNAAEVLERAEDDILLIWRFRKNIGPASIRPIRWNASTRVKRRTNVVGVFPDQPSVLRLAVRS